KAWSATGSCAARAGSPSAPARPRWWTSPRRPGAAGRATSAWPRRARCGRPSTARAASGAPKTSTTTSPVLSLRCGRPRTGDCPPPAKKNRKPDSARGRAPLRRVSARPPAKGSDTPAARRALAPTSGLVRLCRREVLRSQPSECRLDAARIVHTRLPAEHLLQLAIVEVLVLPQHLHGLAREQGRQAQAGGPARQPVAMLEREPDAVGQPVGQAPADLPAAETLGQVIRELPPGDGQAVADVEGLTARGFVAKREHGSVHEVLDVAETGDRATAVDEEHVAPLDRTRDLADHIRRAGPVDGRRTQDHRVEPIGLSHATDFGLRFQLALRVPVAEPRRRVGLLDRRTIGMAVYVRGAEVNEPLDRCADARFEQVASAIDVGGEDLLRGGPVGYQRTAMEHVVTALHGAGERRRARELTGDDLDIELIEPRGVAARAYEAAHRVALRHQSLRQAPADEPGGARDQADSPMRPIDGRAARRRPAHGRFEGPRRRIVAVAMSRTTDQFLLAPP